MKFRYAIYAVALMSTAPAALAQSQLPESMRIDQEADRRFYQNNPPSSTTARTPGATTPGGTQSGDRNRLDVQAPPRQDMQINETNGQNARRNPDANLGSGSAGSTAPYNNVTRNRPSNNSATGTSTGASGSRSPGIPVGPPITPGNPSAGGNTGAGGSAGGAGGGS